MSHIGGVLDGTAHGDAVNVFVAKESLSIFWSYASDSYNLRNDELSIRLFDLLSYLRDTL